MLWSGNRTHDNRIISSTLYPTELPMGDVPDSNRRPAAYRCSTSELTSCGEHLVRTAAYAAGKAVRTGWATSPDHSDSSCYALLLPTVANRQSFGLNRPRATRTEASRCSAHAPVAAAPLPRLRPATGYFRARYCLGTYSAKLFDACASSANAKNKTPRVWRPEGVRLASGDRVTDLHERSSVCLEHACLRFTRHNEVRVATMAPVA